MSWENPTSRTIDTGGAIHDCFGKGDLRGIPARPAPDVEWEHEWGSPSLPWYVARSGREVPQFFASLAQFEFLRLEPFALLERDDIVAVPIHLELRLKWTGRVVKDLEMHPWAFGGDGLVRRWNMSAAATAAALDERGKSPAIFSRTMRR